MDRLDAIATFIAVVDEGGFSAASRRLGMPLASVSRKVQELEQHIGAQLLTRSTRHVTPTEAGDAFALTARRLLDDLQEAERIAAGEYREPRGDLAVAAPIVLGRLHLLPILAEFLDVYPKVRVNLRLSQAPVSLLEDQLHIAITIGELTDSALKAVRVGTIRPVVVASPAYLARHGTPETPEDLAGHRIVTYTGIDEPTVWSFRGGRKVRVEARLVVTTAEAAVDAAAAGLGIAHLLCHQVSPAVDEGRLAVLLREHWGDPLPVHLVHAGQRATPAKVKAFLEFVTPRLRPRLVFRH